MPALVHAQDFLITGKVTDANDSSPLVGVTVKNQSQSSTITDLDGSYSIKAKKGDVLTFSFLGMLSQSVKVESNKSINVALKDDNVALSEIVVVGYGTMKKKDLTGSVSSLDGDKLREMPVANLDQALQGRLAGVQVTSNSGTPGAATSIRIRGASSITSDNEPLYVIDGIPMQGSGTEIAGFDWAGGSNGQNKVNPLAAIAPSDIVSIDVLKDASYVTRSATSITLIVPEKATMGAQTVKMVNYEGKEFKSATTINITGQEPIVDPSLVWADFEDISWTWGLWGGIGQFLKENGNTYYKGTSTGALSGTWLWANNNLVLPACPNITDYVVKADMKITKDFVPGNYAIQMAINGVWGWCDSGFFPMASDGVTASTGGGWITVTWSFSTLGISTAPAGGKTDTGMYINSSSFDWSNVSLDNFRYQKK